MSRKFPHSIRAITLRHICIEVSGKLEDDEGLSNHFSCESNRGSELGYRVERPFEVRAPQMYTVEMGLDPTRPELTFDPQ